VPVYEARCNHCGKLHDYFQNVANYLETPVCCGEKTEKVIFHAPMGYVENIYYSSPIDGKPITTKQARVEDLKRSGCRPWEGMEQEKKEAKRREAYEEQAADSKMEKAIEQTIREMPEEKKTVLGLT
jgi:hypothetical protein